TAPAPRRNALRFASLIAPYAATQNGRRLATCAHRRASRPRRRACAAQSPPETRTRRTRYRRSAFRPRGREREPFPGGTALPARCVPCHFFGDRQRIENGGEFAQGADVRR